MPDSAFFQVGKERREAVEITLRERVVLVVVTLRASHRGPEEDGCRIADAVGRIDREVFLRLRPTFARRLIHPVQTRRDLPTVLLEFRTLQQVSGKLFNDKPVKRLVLVEAVDHVVAIKPHAAVGIFVVPDRVRVPDQVKPIQRQSLAVVFRPKQPLNDFLVRFGRPIGQKRVELLGSRRQPGQIK